MFFLSHHYSIETFRIWNSLTGISSLALFTVMLPKAHLTLHSRMSGSRWVITPSWLSRSWSSFLYSSVFFCSSVYFPGGSDGKASAYNVGDPESIPGSGRSPGEGNGNPLQYSCLENPMDRGAWQAMDSHGQEPDRNLTVHGVSNSWTQLSDFTFTLLTVSW